MAGRRRFTAPAGLIPIASQKITLSNSTAAGLNSTARAGAQYVLFSVNTNNVRVRFDGTDPTLNTGVIFFSGDTYDLSFNGTSSLKFQRTTGTAVVDAHTFKFSNTVG